MNKYKLLTPGPLTVTDTVRKAMDFDYSTWDAEYNAKTQWIRRTLLKVSGVEPNDYTTVLLQGSGTYAMESILNSVTDDKAKLLIIRNGAYGNRIIQMAEYANIDYVDYETAYNAVPNAKEVEKHLQDNPDITHVVMVHSETTTGILNPFEDIAKLAKQYDKYFILDAISSFAGVPINFENVDVFATSSNKCIQGVPGFGIVIIRRDFIEKCKGNATTLSLDLYDQWRTMDTQNGKWRYTSPTHSVAAFEQALKEFIEEGGVEARHKRYQENQTVLVERMAQLGFEVYVPVEYQGPIITTFLYPRNQPNFNFKTFYEYTKIRGYVIYPGKLTDVDTFRIGTIGEIYPQDMINLTEIIKGYMEEYNE